MSENKDIVLLNTLDYDLKEFADTLPYWAKYLYSNLVTGTEPSDEKISTCYGYLKEDLGLAEKTDKPILQFNFSDDLTGVYKDEIIFSSLKDVEGVNALVTKQTIEFSPNITIIYGANGSGKSGYVRLLKNVFYSKHKEKILKNIYNPDNQNPIKADFLFLENETEIPLNYPSDSENNIFKQFAVFDGKIAIQHLEQRNIFEFRPSGLNLFSEFNKNIERLNQKLNDEIPLKPTTNNFIEIFEGESVISNFINNLNSKSDLNILKTHTPFTEMDKTDKQKIEKVYDDLKIAIGTKEKQLKQLNNLKTQVENAEKKLKEINTWFVQTYLDSIKKSINNCNTKLANAKKEGIENFKTDKIKGIGGDEWKDFIEAADKFAKLQKEIPAVYPEDLDHCLFCQQPIQKEQKELILSYWAFLKSEAEKEARIAQKAINDIKEGYNKIPFNQFSDEHILTIWLDENYKERLKTFKQTLKNQEQLYQQIISDIENRTERDYTQIQIDTSQFKSIITDISNRINQLNDSEQNKTLSALLMQKTYLMHKEKLNQQYSKIETLHANMVWVAKANNFNKQYYKSLSTNKEKALSQKFFNKKYIHTFNEECNRLNGNFGIDVDAKSSEGQSNRQLFLKGKTPSSILSEGEQKVIAIADFMAESVLSNINKGIVFDDPVNSLDEERKSIIAERLVTESLNRQVVLFTHDLVFLSGIINYCSDYNADVKCHWIENLDGEVGKIWLNNTPSFEKKYKKSGIAQEYYKRAKVAPPEERESFVKIGFTALRSSYEAFVIFELFAGVVQRFNDRVSIDSLDSVYVNEAIVKEIKDSFGMACRYMEGHSHSDKFLSEKPTPDQLNKEIQRFDNLKKKIKELKN